MRFRFSSEQQIEPGMWDYEGSCSPNAGGGNIPNRTFSVRIFQWVPGKYGTLRRGKAVCRVSGLCSNYKMVYAKAEELCQKFEAGGRPEKKIYIVE